MRKLRRLIMSRPPFVRIDPIKLRTPLKATLSTHGKSHPLATFSPKCLAFTRTDLPG